MSIDHAALNRYALLLGVAGFIAALGQQMSEALSFGHNSWQITEWLINYAGGFVRRGLPGQIIFEVQRFFGVKSNYVVIVCSAVLFCTLAAFFVAKSARRVPLLVIVSPILLGSAVYGWFVIRKDILGVILLIACLYVDQRDMPRAFRDALINVLGVAAILSHEAFFFFGFPALVVVRLLSSNVGKVRKLRVLVGAVLAYFPIAVAFGVVSVYHGDAATAQAINASLTDLWLATDPSLPDLQTPAAAIDAIGWPMNRTLALSYAQLTKFSMGVVYVPLVVLLSVLLCFIYLVGLSGNAPEGATSRASESLHEKCRLAAILSFQLLAISPLFVIGIDYGRWIFLWTTSSMALFLYGYAPEASLAWRIVRHARLIPGIGLLPWQPQQWHLLLIGIPPASWSVYKFMDSSPLFHFVAPALDRVLFG